MTIAISQPAYLPWPGYFDRILACDTFVILDHVQFEKNSVTNRNKIRTKDGWIWLTVPVKTKGHFQNLAINTLRTQEEICWKKKHLLSIKPNYAKTPFFSPLFEHLESFYNGLTTDIFMDAFNGSFRILLDSLGMKPNLVYSSTLDCQKTKSELILEICQKLGATTYISGPFGREYLHKESFDKAGIKILFHEYEYPQYPQRFPGFVPGLSVIDMLFNLGDKTRETLTKGRKLLPC